MSSGLLNLPHNRPLIAKKNRTNKSLPRKVAILCSEVKREYFPTESQYLTEKDAEKDAATLIPHLNRLGVEARVIPADKQVDAKLKHYRPDMVINLVESIRGCEYLNATVPGMLELLEIPYTGAGTLGTTLCMNKYLTKEILSQHGIPVPKFQLFTSWRGRPDPGLKYPLVLKLNEVHGSLEMTKDSIVENYPELRKRLHWLMKTYDQDVLAEEYIEGREFAAFVFHAYNKKVYAIERVFLNGNGNEKRKYKFMDFDLVWKAEKDEFFRRVEHRKHRDPLLNELVKKAFEVVQMEDYGKFDVRQDRFGRYYFIDSNPNCYFAPPDNICLCDLTMTMKMYGVPFKLLLKKMLINTLQAWAE